MRTIPVTISKTRKAIALVDEANYERLMEVRWYLDSKGYAYSTKRVGGGRRILTRMHRLITKAPRGKSVDHANGDKLDNRESNLRVCSHAENMRNSKLSKANRSGVRGVSWNSRLNKWRAVITHDKKYYNLGHFAVLEDAKKAYQLRAMELFGDFYRKGCN